MNTLEYLLEKYPDKPWDWLNISDNPNITIEIIEKYIDKIDFDTLSYNEFTYQNKLNRQKEAYMLLEKDQSFHKLQNLYVVKQYM